MNGVYHHTIWGKGKVIISKVDGYDGGVHPDNAMERRENTRRL